MYNKWLAMHNDNKERDRKQAIGITQPHYNKLMEALLVWFFGEWKLCSGLKVWVSFSPLQRPTHLWKNI
jgi:hypothetical protein